MSVSVDSLCEPHRLDQIPTFPPVLLALLRACQHPEPCSRDVESLVGQDAAISVRLLAVASSPVYARGRAPADIKQAIQLLGLETVNTIGVIAGIHQFFYRLDGQHHHWLPEFFRHSLAAAVTARGLAEFGADVDPDQAYLAGLLHDIGQPLLSVLYQDRMQQLRQRATAEGRPLVELERETFGTSHDELAAALVERWELPGFLTDALRYHHAPLDQLADAHPLVRIVHLASLLADMPAEPDAESLHAAATLFNLGRAATSRLHHQAMRETDLLLKALGDEESEPDIGIPPTRSALMDQVRNSALLGSIAPQLRQSDSSCEIEIIAQGLALLFGMRMPICLEVADGGTSLRASVPWPAGTELEALQIPLDGKRSLIARSLTENRPLHTLDPEEAKQLSVVDRQLASRLPGDGVLCLPLRHKGTACGVLVLGIRHTQISAMLDQSELLLAFAGEAAGLLDRARRARLLRQQVEADSLWQQRQQTLGISRQLGDPVTVIRNYLHVLQQQVDEAHPGRENLLTIVDEMERVGQILGRLGEGTGPDAGSQADVNLVVQELIMIARQAELLPASMPVHQHTDAKLDGQKAPGALLRSLVLALLRLLGSAGAGGELSLSTSADVRINGERYHELSLEADSSDPAFAQLDHDRSLHQARQHLRDEGGLVNWTLNKGKRLRVQILWPAPGDTK
ncbi:MAG: HDOD domain-containing protein [Ectothiorhodospiraceae bacterium]|nr:HDOD domain-containing protein [Ectothiorhodospiraceae bacterium]